MAFIIILVLVGVLLVLTEILLIPGVGFAGILGLLSMGGSCYYAFKMFGLTAGAIVTAVNIVLVVVLLIYVLRAKTWKKLALKTNIDAKVNESDEGKIVVGDKGRTLSRLNPFGTAMFGTLSIEVKSLEGMIDPGTEVEVVLIEDSKIYVKPITEEF